MDTERITERARVWLGRQVTRPEREAGYVFHHGLRVARLALRLSEQIDEPLDTSREVLYTGALYHDAAKGEPKHNEAGAALVCSVLGDLCTDEELRQVAQIVRGHPCRQQGDWPVSVRLVQDADRLDHFGAQMVWLMFHWNAHNGQPPEESLAYHRSDANRDYQERSRRGLNFDAARSAFDRRIAFERDFLARFERELLGEEDWGV